MAYYRPGVPRPTEVLNEMTWDHVEFTREQINRDTTAGCKTVKAILIPDGQIMNNWVWIRVPLHPGVRKAATVHELDTDVWIDAGRGSSGPSYDRTGRVFQINRFPFDEPEPLQHSFTIVVAPQNTTGPNVHPINVKINRRVPSLEEPWRGNVLVFRHSSQQNKPLVNVEEKDCTVVECIITTAFRTGFHFGIKAWNGIGCSSLCLAQSSTPPAFCEPANQLLVPILFGAFVELSHVNKQCQTYAKSYLRGRVARYTSPFFTTTIAPMPLVNTESPRMFKLFFEVMLRTKSWIVGSVALAVASVLSDPSCPLNLNIITSRTRLKDWLYFLRKSGFIVYSMSWSSGAYADAGRVRVTMCHPLIQASCARLHPDPTLMQLTVQPYNVYITTAASEDLGALFFAGHNTDQWVAIGAHEIITPVLENVSEQRHLQGWRPASLGLSLLTPQSIRPTYREEPTFPGATTLDPTTEHWGRPCGLSCPSLRRTVKGLPGFAHIKWGGMDGKDEATDLALRIIGETERVYRTGSVCINARCRRSPCYEASLVDEESDYSEG
ncbi:hypothetical protein DFH06DRAFT_1340282 [Mycena polygramma]|nr:hypothetical protein DFH06DRAFT_1340282 [Mycena polygramma]